MDLSRILRIALGAGIIIYGIVIQSWIGLIGLFPLITGLTNRCPSFLSPSNSSCSIPPPDKSETK